MRLPDPPAAFRDNLLAAAGEEGERWLAELPDVIAPIAERWDVSPESWLRGGLASCVLLAERRGERVVLKLPYRPEDSRRERVALRAWAGHGAVSLLAEDEATGAVLLAYVTGRTLDELDEHAALAAAAPMLRALHERPAGETALPTTLERHEAWLELLDDLLGHRRDLPLSPSQRERADRLARELADGGATRTACVLHGDLNPRNVLVSPDGIAVAIDPFGQTGDPSTDIANLALWAPGEPSGVLDRVARLGRATGHDVERTLAHAYVVAVMVALFRIGAGHLDNEPLLAFVAAYEAR